MSAHFNWPVIWRFATIIALVLTFPSTSVAHRIDGNWCDGKGKHVNIDGSTIRTPGGNFTTGSRERNSMEYVVPEGEEHAGKTLKLQQYTDDYVELVLPDGTIERWRPCNLTS